VYETIVVRAARHPSETEEHLLVRLLAYTLEYTEGIEFSRGLAEPDEPAIRVRDLTGETKIWIEVGSPAAERLHRATRATPRVVVYTQRDPRLLLKQYEGERIHRREEVEVYSFDREFIDSVAPRLDRRTAMLLSVSDRQIYLTVGGASYTTPIVRSAIP